MFTTAKYADLNVDSHSLWGITALDFEVFLFLLNFYFYFYFNIFYNHKKTTPGIKIWVGLKNVATTVKSKKKKKKKKKKKCIFLLINPFLTAMRLQHYLGKLFVAFARFPIEGISDGKKTTSSITRN
jgi:hypothetical protein